MPVCYRPALAYFTNNFSVIGDRERCLNAGMDDHITSKSLFIFVLRVDHFL